MKRRSRKNRWKSGIRGITCCLGAVIYIATASLTADAASGTVIAESAKIRSSAGISGEALASVKKDEKLDIIGKTDGSDGKAWYEVYVNGETKGYIRSDLLNVEGDVASLTATSAATGGATETAATVTESTAKSGKITTASVNVRKGPAKTDAVVGSLKQNNEVSITGETNGSDGMLWYQISAEINGKQVTGFVRSDLLEVTDTGETGEASPEEGAENAENEENSSEPEEEGGSEINRVISSRILPAGTDISSLPIDEATLESWEDGRYYLLYMIDDDGSNYWYLYDLDNHAYQRADSLSSGEAQEPAADTGGFGTTAKIVVAILVAVVVILIVIIVLLALKLRKADYDEEDDDDDEDDEEGADGRVNSRAWRPRNFLRSSADDEDGEEDDEEEEEEDYEPVRRPVKRAPARPEAPRRRPEGEARPVTRQRAPEPPRRRPEGNEGEIPRRKPEGEARPVTRQRAPEPPRRRPEGSEGRNMGDAPVRRRPEGAQEAPVRRRPEGEARPVTRQRAPEPPRRRPEGNEDRGMPEGRPEAPAKRRPGGDAPAAGQARRRPEEARTEQPVRKAPPKRSLYEEDDEFEFEFLNMDGKEDL